MTYTEVIPLILATFVLVLVRFYLRWRYPDGLTGDVYFHLLCAKAIRENGLRIPRSLPGFIWDTGYTYPPLYHWILALFSEKGRRYVERYSSVTFDLLQVGSVFFMTWQYLLPKAGFTQNSCVWTALGVAGVLLLSPLFNAQIWGPRVVTGTARPLGEFLFVLGTVGLLAWDINGQIPWAIGSALVFGLIPLTSKFALQVLVCFVLYITAIGQWSWLCVIVGGISGVILLTGGLPLRVIRGHYGHTHFYFHFLQHHYHGLERGTSLFFGVTGYLSRWWQAVKAPSTFIRWFFSERSMYHVLFFFNLPMWALLGLYLIEPSRFAVIAALPSPILLLCLAPVLPVLITLLPYARCFGESYRYLEYYQWLYWLILAVVSWKAFMVLAAISLVFDIFVVSDARKQLKVWQDTQRQSQLFFAFVKEHLSKQKVFALGGLYYECIFRGDVSVLLWSGNMRLETVPQEELEVLFDSFPFPKAGDEYQAVLDRYEINYIIIHEQVMHYLESVSFAGYEKVDAPSCQLLLLKRRRAASCLSN